MKEGAQLCALFKLSNDLRRSLPPAGGKRFLAAVPGTDAGERQIEGGKPWSGRSSAYRS